MLQELKKLYGANAMWTCVQQRDAIQELMKLDTDIVVALRTGIGKSLIAILPSRVETGYTVIIVPLVALMEDWIRRLDKLKISYEHFKGASTDQLKGHSNIILVSSDVATGRNASWIFTIADLYFA